MIKVLKFLPVGIMIMTCEVRAGLQDEWALKLALKKAILRVLIRTIELQHSHKQILI